MLSDYLKSLYQIRIFLLIIGIYVLTLGSLLSIYGYRDSFIIMNNNHCALLDWPMFIITHLGDSLILTSIISLIFIQKKPHTVILVILVVITTGLISQVLKNVYFSEWDRPLKVFNESPLVYTLPNYRLFHNSFPSGHSITAMAAFTALIWSLKPRLRVQITLALAAVIISYSRIYLGAHFPGDVFAGSLIGVIITLLLVPYAERIINKVKFNRTSLVIIMTIAILSLLTGIWLLRVYFPHF